MKNIGLLSVIILIIGMLSGCDNDAEKNKVAVDEPKESIQTISTEKVKAVIDDKNWVIVDTRINDAFNGWKLDGVVRGGHIQNAVDFAANWLKVDVEGKEQTLNDALKTKGITVEKNVILYDANGSDALAVGSYLESKGYKNLYIYDVKAWAKDDSLPMVKYPNYQLITPAVIVKDIIDGKKPESFETSGDIKIIEASWGEEKTSYAKGHVPTAFHINTDLIEPPTKTKPTMWILADDKALAEFALEYGFKKEDTVIVTSDEPLSAYRVATVLRYIGVSDVRVLNGGISSWTAAGYELETKSNKSTAVADFGGPIPGNPDVIDTMAEVKKGLKTPETFTLIDNRTWSEHIGESTGYSYHDKAGRIPGAKFGYAGKSNAYSMDYYRNIDKTMRNASEFIALWDEQGIDQSKHMSFHCGSGWRVAEIYYFADVVGIKDIGIFSDGWIGWSNDASNPIETGDPK